MPSDGAAPGQTGLPGQAAADGRGRRGSGRGDLVQRLFTRLLDVRPHEIAMLGWAWLYVLSVMSACCKMFPLWGEDDRQLVQAA